MKKNKFKFITKISTYACIATNALFILFSLVMWLLVLFNVIFVPNFYAVICYLIIAINFIFAIELCSYLIFRKE